MWLTCYSEHMYMYVLYFIHAQNLAWFPLLCTLGSALRIVSGPAHKTMCTQHRYSQSWCHLQQIKCSALMYCYRKYSYKHYDPQQKCIGVAHDPAEQWLPGPMFALINHTPLFRCGNHGGVAAGSARSPPAWLRIWLSIIRGARPSRTLRAI